MSTPDKKIVIERLQKLPQQAEIFDRHDSGFYRTADFEIWLSEVGSWLHKGSPYTDEECDKLPSMRFTPISYYTGNWGQNKEDRWHGGLKMARHLLERAIENLDKDWA